MGAGLVAAAHEAGLGVIDGLESFARGLAGDLRGVGLGADDDEVVVHDLTAVDAVASSMNFFSTSGA